MNLDGDDDYDDDDGDDGNDYDGDDIDVSIPFSGQQYLNFEQQKVMANSHPCMLDACKSERHTATNMVKKW